MTLIVRGAFRDFVAAPPGLATLGEVAEDGRRGGRRGAIDEGGAGDVQPGVAKAIIKGGDADASDRVGDRDAREAAATIKGAGADAGDRVGDRDAREAGATIKGFVADAGDRVGDRDAREPAATSLGFRCTNRSET